MASVLKGQSGQPIQFETKPNVNGDDVTTESAISTPNNALIKSALNAGGDAPVYACRAWVNFNGDGTIYASGNVSSVTQRNTARFTVNLATAMPDTNYIVQGTEWQLNRTTANHSNVYESSPDAQRTTTSFFVEVTQGNTAFYPTNVHRLYISIFR